MTDLPPPPTPPGWYPDPWYPASMRWFDGRTWTAHAAPAGPRADPYDPVKGASAARYAGYAFLARGAMAAVQCIAAPVVMGRFFQSFFDSWDDPESVQQLDAFGFTGFSVLSQLASLLMLGCLVFLCIWTFRATTNARALGLRTTYEPGWTVGAWIIPFANFVMPWQSVRDLFPVDHPGRRRAGMWWTFEISAIVVTFVAYGAAIGFGAGPGAAVGVVAAACALTAAILGHRLCGQVVQVHEAIAHPTTSSPRDGA